MFLVLILLAGLLVGFVGVFGVRQLLDRRTVSAAPDSAMTTPAVPQQPSPAVPSTTPAASVLPNLVVQQGDVGPTVAVTQIPNGAAVTGAATLDLCNGTFPSESLRTARLQVAAYDQQGDANSSTAQLSTEAVTYRSAAATAQAFAELRSVAARCPTTPVPSPVGEPPVTTKMLGAPDSAWPRTASVTRQAYHFTSTDATGSASTSMAVYLTRGLILLALYFPQPEGAQSPVAGQSTVSGIVNAFQHRLAGIPAHAVGG